MSKEYTVWSKPRNLKSNLKSLPIQYEIDNQSYVFWKNLWTYFSQNVNSQFYMSGSIRLQKSVIFVLELTLAWVLKRKLMYR